MVKLKSQSALPLVRRLGYLAATVALLAGCGSSEQALLNEFTRDFDFESMIGDVQEFQLGSYRIASAVKQRSASGAPAKTMWIHIRFHLYAMVDSQEVKRVQAALKRHRGELDDTVVTICRTATIEELSDVRTAVLKNRLIDAVRTILGEERILQLSFSDTFQWEPM